MRGYDAGNKTAGRKRQILIDVVGLLLGVYSGPADEQDRDGAKTLLRRFFCWYALLAKIWGIRAAEGSKSSSRRLTTRASPPLRKERSSGLTLARACLVPSQ
ncbi:MAG: transposase [Limisphaerales bacterium]